MAAREEVTLVIRARDLTRTAFARLRRSVRSLRFQIGTLIAGGALGAFARQATEAATEIQAIADQLGISAEEAQALELIAGDINQPFQSLANVVQRVNRNFGDAIRNGGGVAEAFQELRVPIDESRYRTTLDLLVAIVNQARELGIESREVQSALARIADTEGLNIIRRLISRGGNLRLEIDDLAPQLRPAAEIAETAQDEAEIRRELIKLQREFAQELRVLLPALLQLTRELNTFVGFVNEIRGSADPAETFARGVGATVPGVSAAQEFVRESGIGARAFEADAAIARFADRVAEAIERVQRPILNAFRIGD